MLRSLICGFAAATVLASGNIINADDLVPIIGWDQQLFPSYIISTARMKTEPAEDDAEDEDETEQQETEETEPETVTVGDENGLLGVQITAPSRNAKVKVTISCEEIMEPSSFTGVLPDKGVVYDVYPQIKYRYTKLAEFNQVTPVSMTFRIQIGKSEPLEHTATVMVRPINDCPFFVQAGDELINTSYTFAAYVNEQHPYLDKLLREALDNGVVDSFTGYQSKDTGEVIRQVYALWDALVQRDVRYSSITATSGDADAVASQHVRLIEQSVNNSQANCVDGSVLFASLLRKIGVDPFLVLEPGHCYVGFYLDAEKTELVAIETTMLGTVIEDGDTYQTTDNLEAAVDEELRDEYSWPSFTSAMVHASQQFEEAREKFADPAEMQHLIIDIAESRKMGILPIAFRGKEEFLSNNVDDSVSDADEAEDEE